MAPTTQMKNPPAFLTISQKDCLAQRGNCETCFHARLISEPCKVKYSEGVAEHLGLPIKRRNDFRRAKPFDRPLDNCAVCNKVYAPTRLRQTNCEPCIDRYGSKAKTLTCKCGAAFITTRHDRTKCDGCTRKRFR